MLETDSVASKNCCCYKISLRAWVVILVISFFLVCSLSSSGVDNACHGTVMKFQMRLEDSQWRKSVLHWENLGISGSVGLLFKDLYKPKLCRWRRKAEDLSLSWFYLISTWVQSVPFQFVQGKRVHWLSIFIKSCDGFSITGSLVTDLLMIEFLDGFL